MNCPSQKKWIWINEEINEIISLKQIKFMRVPQESINKQVNLNLYSLIIGISLVT